jgi:hypothetical protein
MYPRDQPASLLLEVCTARRSGGRPLAGTVEVGLSTSTSARINAAARRKSSSRRRRCRTAPIRAGADNSAHIVGIIMDLLGPFAGGMGRTVV